MLRGGSCWIPAGMSPGRVDGLLLEPTGVTRVPPSHPPLRCSTLSLLPAVVGHVEAALLAFCVALLFLQSKAPSQLSSLPSSQQQAAGRGCQEMQANTGKRPSGRGHAPG